MKFLTTFRQKKLSNISFYSADIYLFLAAFAVICGAILFGNINEDAFIIFRSIENFMHGFGLQYVIDDRSQSYTDPLWIICHVLLRFVFSNILYASIFFSLLCTALMLYVISRYFSATKWLVTCFIFIPLALSISFLEYSTSGLENPLSHLLAAWFFCIFFKEPSLKNISNQKIFFLSTLACLAIFNRFDTVIFYAAPLFSIALIRKNGFFKTSILIASAFTPLLLWLIFATFYYGYPLPDTYYSKLAAQTPEKLMLLFSLNYYYRFIETNLSSALLILGSLGFSLFVICKKIITLKAAFFKNEAALRTSAAAVSIILYLSYCLTIGDYMLGRFFTITLLVALLLLVYNFSTYENFGERKNKIFCGLFALIILVKIANIFSGNFIYNCSPEHIKTDYECKKKNAYQWKSWVHIYRTFTPSWKLTKNSHIAQDWPDIGAMLNVVSKLDSTKRPFHFTHFSAGVMPFYAGEYYWITDELAYTEPFLVRLPAVFHKPGHFIRSLPSGYIDWRFNDKERALDSDLKYYYNNLRDIKTQPLFNISRLKKIIAFNSGTYNDYLHRYITNSYIPNMLKSKNYSEPLLGECNFITRSNGSAFGSPFRNFICDKVEITDQHLSEKYHDLTK